MKTKQDLIIDFLFEQQGQFHAPDAELLAKFCDYTFGWVSVEEGLPKPNELVEVRYSIAKDCEEITLLELSDDAVWHYRGKDFYKPLAITHWREIIE